MERITQLIADLTEYDSIAEGLKAGKSPVEVTRTRTDSQGKSDGSAGGTAAQTGGCHLCG